MTCHVTPNYAKVSIKVWIFYGQSFTDVALGVPEILRGHKVPPPCGYIGQKRWIGLIGHFTKENIFVKKRWLIKVRLAGGITTFGYYPKI